MPDHKGHSTCTEDDRHDGCYRAPIPSMALSRNCDEYRVTAQPKFGTYRSVLSW